MIHGPKAVSGSESDKIRTPPRVQTMSRHKAPAGSGNVQIIDLLGVSLFWDSPNNFIAIIIIDTWNILH